MSSTPRSLEGFTSAGEAVFGEDEPTSGTYTPVPGPSWSKSTPVDAHQLARALLYRRRTDTEGRFLSKDVLSSDDESGSGYVSTHSAEWDHEYDLSSHLQQDWVQRRGMERTPPPIRRNPDASDRSGEHLQDPNPPAGTAAMTEPAATGEDKRLRATNEAKVAVMAAITAWEDDFDGLDPGDVPVCLLRQRISEVDEFKKTLQQNEPRLSLAGPPIYPASMRDQVNRARKGFSALNRTLMKSLAAFEELNRVPVDLTAAQQVAGAAPAANGATPTPAATIKAPIIEQDVSMVTAQVDSMLTALDDLRQEPSDEREYRLYLSKTASALQQIESIKVFATQVINEAAACNMAAMMTAANDKLTELRTREDILRTADRRARSTFGAVSESSKEYISKAPVFAGDPDRGSDFFTFRRDWTAFKKQAHASEAKLLHILLNESLTGTAKTSCSELDSEARIFKRLEKMFGNVSFLIQHKIEEVQKLKRCEGSSIKKREWLIEVSSKMIALRDLAVKHKKEEKVYNSILTDHVMQSLPSSWQEGFRAYAHKKHGIRDSSSDEDNSQDEDDDATVDSLSMKSMYETLIKFLQRKVKKCTFDIDYDLSVQRSRDDRKSGPAAPAPKSSGGKATKAYTAVDVPAPAAPAHVCAVQPSATPSDRKSDKKPKSDGKGKAAKKDKGKDRGKAGNQAGGATTVAAPAFTAPAERKCAWCKGQHTHAYYCEEFQHTLAVLRMKKCYDASVCFKCLRMDSDVDLSNKEWSKRHRKDCNDDWLCNIEGCAQKPFYKRTHFLICGFHAAENEVTVKDFVKQLDHSKISPTAKFMTCYPTYFSTPSEEVPIHLALDGYEIEPDTNNNSIFMCQTVIENGEQMLLFYDGGCHGAGISDRAAKILKSTCVREGPTNMGVAGGGTVTIPHGDEQFVLPLVGDKKKCLVTGLRMDEITSTFPTWNVKEAWVAISSEFSRAFPGATLPAEAPAKVGGARVDLMMGIRYVRFFPELLYILPSGLAIYQSKIRAANDQNLVLAGPHSAWNHATLQANLHSAHVFFTQEMRAYYYHNLALTSPMSLPEPETEDNVSNSDMHACLNNPYQSFDEAPVYGIQDFADRLFCPEIFETEITYRCMKCRNCNECRNSERVNELSLKEEREQSMIDEAVTFDPEKKMLFSTLPFIQDPNQYLKPNRHIAECILSSQLKIVENNEQGRNDVIAAHEKLRSKGFVQKLSELDEETQRLIDIGGVTVKYWIPWRMQWKASSLSSPGRMVFDASSMTPGGKSLNCILAKGQNRLSKLFHVLLKFRAGAEGFLADISMAYNNVWLKPEYLRFQLYLWKEGLDRNAPTEVFVIKTLIYGVRPSGNLMMAAFKLVSDYAVRNWPEHARGANALQKAYVDDLVHATRDKGSAKEDANSLLFVLSLAQLSIKGFTFSGQAPPAEVSADGKTVGLLGMVWEPAEDLVNVDAKPVFFGKVRRGKLPELVTGDIKTAFSKKFTKRTVLAKMASLFDPLCLFAPLTVKFKLGFSTICNLKTDWDELLPPAYLDEWVGYLEEIQEVKKIKLRRSVIPPNAATTNVDVIVSADASQWLAACVAHARVPLVDGGYHVQILCARTKITKDLTVPKAEMRAMTMAAGLGHVIKQQLGDQVTGITYVTDSTIALCQLNLDSRPMETLTRNCVIEIRRLTDPSDWFHVDSANNVADLATRAATLSDVGPDSAWQQGMAWMRQEKGSMPLKTVSQIISSSESKRLEATSNVEKAYPALISPKVKERYQEYKYLYDPNKYGWAKALRVVGYVLKFLRIKCPRWKPTYAPPPPPRHVSVPVETGTRGLTRFDVRFAEHYYFFTATLEVKKHTPLKLYKDDTFERYGILFHAGRILDGHQVDTPVDRFIDMEPLSFVKPVGDRYSPISYAVMVHAHGSIRTHRTASATLTESRSIMFIFQGRNLANQVREGCQECRVFKLRLMEVEMAPLDSSRLTIAPPFFISQVDLAGPFMAHSEHNLRAVVKVWLCVFKCTTSCAVTAHVITKYTTAAVLSAYTRFAKSYGHPGMLLIDQGTQLMAACDKMQVSVLDLSDALNCKFQVGVEHRVCPARAHNYQGMVERSIAEIKRLLYKVTKATKLDIMGYETAAAWICNDLNNLPIALGSRTEHLDNLDVITPSRLLLGRNNRRAMSGYPRLDMPSRMMKQQDELYQIWWDVWRKERLADFIPQPNKWRNNTVELKVGDIVAFVQHETGDHHGKPIYKLGRVTAVEHSADGLIRTCSIQYKNAANPTLFQNTRMSVRHVAVVHSENDLDIVQQLNVAARTANALYYVMSCFNAG